MSIGIAVVGVGWAGSRHVEAISELRRTGDERLHVEMLVDTDTAHLAEKASEFDVDKVATSLDDALSDSSVAAVSIATPHGMHRDEAIASARSGKHVMVEKPMAVSVADARQMIDVADANDIGLYVAESETYSPMTATLRELVTSRKYTGDLTHASVVAGFRAEPRYQYPGRRSWLAQPSMGGSGTWLLHGVHTVAQLRAILGEVETIYARESHTRSFPSPEVEGTITALLRMESGISVTLVQSCETSFERDQRGYTFYGERGTIMANRDGAIAYGPELDEPRKIEYPKHSLSEYALEFQAFADFIADQVEGPTSGRSEIRSLAIVQAGYESAASGIPINLRERFGDL